MAIVPLSVTAARERVADFGPFFMSGSVSFVLDADTVEPQPSCNVREFVEQESIRFLVIKSSATRREIITSTLYEKAIIRRKMETVDTVEEGFAKVRSDGNYAFIIDEPIAKYEAQKYPDDFVIYNFESFLEYHYAIASSINSKLDIPLRYAVLVLMEGAHIRRLQEKWWGPQIKCPL